MQPNRLGLGLRQPLPSYGQGPSMSALAQQQQFVPQQANKPTKLFIGSISGGITDAFLNDLLRACGPINSFKRLITPANKPQGFGFAEFTEPDGALRAMALLNGVELPALEDGCANKTLLVKADEQTKGMLDQYQANRMRTDADEAQNSASKAKVQELLAEIHKIAEDLVSSGAPGSKYIIPPHLHDLQEADLPETQRGLVISEIAMFREKAAKRERERDAPRPGMGGGMGPGGGAGAGAGMGMGAGRGATNNMNAPSGPKQREWGKTQDGPSHRQQGFGNGAQGYNKPVGFVRAEDGPAGSGGYDDGRHVPGKGSKTDLELEDERKAARRKDEESSFRDRERRYEPRERARITALERAIQKERAIADAEARDRIEIRARLDVWDDDESDENFYVDRPRWRQQRARRLAAEQSADAESRAFEDREAENLRRESEAFLARQMDEMQALAEEQRKAGLLLDDGAPVKLNVGLPSFSLEKKPAAEGVPEGEKKAVFGADEDEDESGLGKKKLTLVKLDFSAAESGEKAQERLETIKASVPFDKETLFKAKVRWDGVTDLMIDRKLEPLIKRQMTKYLGELEDDDLVMFVLEHLKDHKGPVKLVEGLEPVLEEEATEFAIGIWRQIIFESMAYGEGLQTEKTLVD